jgi:hypothetical protein
MDGNFSNIIHFEADNFDDEVYYGEMQGWRASVEENEEGSKLASTGNRIALCDHPQHRKARLNAEGLAGIGIGDVPC